MKRPLISLGLALALATPLTARADDSRWSASPMSPNWSSAMPASDQIYGPSLGPSPMGRDRTRVKPRRWRHEGAVSATDSGRDAVSTWHPLNGPGRRGANPGAKATGWGAGAAGVLAGGHNP
jgi:hypothetical protein